MLASDVNNQEFVGAHDPDSKLFVEFYMHDPEDWNKSQAAGKKVLIGTPIPYVRIMVPGDKTSTLETPVREEHKIRFPKQWMAFQIREGMVGGEAEVPGWPLEEWTELSPEQVRELKFMRYSVVEQIAGASDAQIQRIGMGGLGLREKAKQALRNRMGAEVKEELERKDRELADMKARMEKMEAMIMAPKPKKVGRPKKVQVGEQHPT